MASIQRNGYKAWGGIERDEQDEYERNCVKFKKSDKYIYFL